MNNRLYSLFEKRGFRYHRITQLAFYKAQAVRVFQDHLLTYPSYCLRPVKDTGFGTTHVYNPPVEHLSQDGEEVVR